MTQPPPGYGYDPNAYQPSPYGAAPAGYPNPYGAAPAGYPSPQWNYGPPVPNPHAYTSWLDRVLASVIDQLPMVAIIGVGYGLMMVGILTVDSTTDSGTGEPSGFAIGLLFLGMLAMFAGAIAYWVWNFGYRQGTTGQSIGKKAMKFKVISEKTGQPVGFGMSVVRQMAHQLDALFYIGYLMPLWDSKRQTIADKIMTTVCVPAPVPTAPVMPTMPAMGDGPNPYGYPPR
ncbi:putative RDD family membrane protein YckC [Mycobacterium frederiksbergense]|uniref:RDD family membrane protein YckC n=1 Tax=Mycolicibacterium frederiksbergense TaxID=117567 RepID=A0ABT6L6Z4_9MYCO|nr:RDD family protein [Mycolicibacterium frederiksbergense]MDH6197735.1 putative RDD family membrane protein YckC [Mycolicibacterium frederiksbergense]